MVLVGEREGCPLVTMVKEIVRKTSFLSLYLLTSDLGLLQTDVSLGNGTIIEGDVTKRGALFDM